MHGSTIWNLSISFKIISWRHQSHQFSIVKFDPLLQCVIRIHYFLEVLKQPSPWTCYIEELELIVTSFTNNSLTISECIQELCSGLCDSAQLWYREQKNSFFLSVQSKNSVPFNRLGVLFKKLPESDGFWKKECDRKIASNAIKACMFR